MTGNFVFFSGAYILLDLVLARMNKGAREIDIAATLEHLRDQRAALVATRQQFEFVLMAVAEEVRYSSIIMGFILWCINSS